MQSRGMMHSQGHIWGGKVLLLPSQHRRRFPVAYFLQDLFCDARKLEMLLDPIHVEVVHDLNVLVEEGGEAGGVVLGTAACAPPARARVHA